MSSNRNAAFRILIDKLYMFRDSYEMKGLKKFENIGATFFSPYES